MTAEASRIAAREAQVLSTGPRLAPLTRAEMNEDAVALARDIGAALGIALPEDELAVYFTIMFRHPGLYRCQMEAGIQLLGRGTLPPRERELAVLRTAWLCGAPYEWSEHVALAHKFGASAEEIERVTIGSAAPEWCPHMRAVMRAVEELLADTMISDATWAVLAQSWDDRQLIELPSLVGNYVSVAMIQNSLRVPLGNDARGLRAR